MGRWVVIGGWSLTPICWLRLVSGCGRLGEEHRSCRLFLHLAGHLPLEFCFCSHGPPGKVNNTHVDPGSLLQPGLQPYLSPAWGANPNGLQDDPLHCTDQPQVPQSLAHKGQARGAHSQSRLGGVRANGESESCLKCNRFRSSYHCSKRSPNPESMLGTNFC